MDLHLGALIHIAVQWLVRLVGAIRNLVAHQLVVDALPIVAGELALRAGVVFLLATRLVRVVSTVVLTVAPILHPDALKVLAGELLWRAGLVLAVASLALIRAVATIVVVVAYPTLIDAPSIGTCKLIISAGLRCGTVVQCCIFIRSINTIRIPIAYPLLRNTLRPGPGLVLLAGKFGLLIALPIIALMPIILITIIQTVIVSITDINSRNAVAIITGKQISKAGPSLGLAVLWRLIRPITTIIVPIAVPGSRDASMIWTAEAVLRTCPLGTVQRILVRVISAIIVPIA